MNKAILYCGFLLFLISCGQKSIDSEKQHQSETSNGIIGMWRLYESGYSTGASFHIDTYPANPLQTISFNSQGQVSKQGRNVGDYFAYPYYRVDTIQNNYWLRLSPSPNDTTGNRASLKIKGDTMSIIPFCAEGCYLSFIRINNGI